MFVGLNWYISDLVVAICVFLIVFFIDIKFILFFYVVLIVTTSSTQSNSISHFSNNCSVISLKLKLILFF